MPCSGFYDASAENLIIGLFFRKDLGIMPHGCLMSPETKVFESATHSENGARIKKLTYRMAKCLTFSCLIQNYNTIQKKTHKKMKAFRVDFFIFNRFWSYIHKFTCTGMLPYLRGLSC